MSSQRILHVSQPVVDGVAVVVADLADYLVSCGDEVAVACPSSGYLPDRLSKAGIRHLHWNATREPGGSTLSETRSLSRIIADYDPAVVHLHSSKAGLAGRLAMRGHTPTVFSPHAWSFYHLQGALQKAALAWERFGARWCEVILCGSVEEEAAGREHRIRARYEVVPNSSVIEGIPVDRAQARGLLEVLVDPDAPLVVCLGRLTRQKGQDVMLRAWPLISRSVPAARLVIAGQGPDERMLREMATPDVIFRGIPERSSVGLWMMASDVMVFPSRWETLSLAVLEAMQLGRPVVVSDCGGMREALAGGVGEMVPVDDVQGLAAAVVPYVADRHYADVRGREAKELYEAVHAPARQRSLARYRALITGLRK